MPTYEYECTKCGAVTEVYQPITEPPRRRLKAKDRPSCDCHAPVRRRIGTGAGIIFKGAGFYETDYRSESYKKAAKAEKDAVEGKSKSDGDGKAGKTKEDRKGKSTTAKEPASAAADK